MHTCTHTYTHNSDKCMQWIFMKMETHLLPEDCLIPKGLILPLFLSRYLLLLVQSAHRFAQKKPNMNVFLLSSTTHCRPKTRRATAQTFHIHHTCKTSSVISLCYMIDHHEYLSSFMQLYKRMTAFTVKCDLLEWTSRSFKLKSNCRVYCAYPKTKFETNPFTTVLTNEMINNIKSQEWAVLPCNETSLSITKLDLETSARFLCVHSGYMVCTVPSLRKWMG